jgi:hypothetical protein
MKTFAVKPFYFYLTTLTIFVSLTYTDIITSPQNTGICVYDSINCIIQSKTADFTTLSINNEIFISQYPGELSQPESTPRFSFALKSAVGMKWIIKAAPPKASADTDLLPWD